MPTLFMNSNECDCPAQTDFRLGKHELLDKYELRHVGNSIEVSRHSTTMFQDSSQLLSSFNEVRFFGRH
jgi:hypothetical protein